MAQPQLLSHLEKLVAFNAVVKAGSIRKAAVDLNMTQPALSRSIAILEQSIECRLFRREQTGVTLTSQGAELFSFSERLVRDTYTVEQKILNGTFDLESSFIIGTYDSIAIYFFPSFLNHIKSTQKKLQIHLRTAMSSQLMKDLQSGHVDLIVSVNPSPCRTVISKDLFHDFYSFYASPKLEPSEKLKLIYVANAMDKEGKALEHYAADFGVPKNEIIHCENFETVRALTESGLGVGILPSRVAERSLQRSDLVPAALSSKIPSRFGEHWIAFSYLKSREGDSAINWVHHEISRFLTPQKNAKPGAN
jgi:LysR family hydrogen peroxide-inducible transcriptional activator